MPLPSQSVLCMLLLTANQNQATNVLILYVYLAIQTKVVTHRVVLLRFFFFITCSSILCLLSCYFHKNQPLLHLFRKRNPNELQNYVPVSKQVVKP